MIVIGLDQALANTGWSVVQYKNEKLTLLEHGTYKTSSKEKKLEKRLLDIRQFIESLTLKYLPDKVFTEYVYLCKANPGSGRLLLKVESIIHLYLHENDIDFDIVSSSSRNKGGWRKELGIKKNKNKNEESKEFFKNIGTFNEHSADSLAIILTGLLNKDIITINDINRFLFRSKKD